MEMKLPEDVRQQWIGVTSNTLAEVFDIGTSPNARREATQVLDAIAPLIIEWARKDAVNSTEVVTQMRRYLERFEGGRATVTHSQRVTVEAMQSIVDGAPVAWAPSDDGSPR